ncbi:MAG: TonB-dependent receptor plug domain-containing protein, partial [Verrucomicrobiae bacterium]|nr:TonB-dependent receptor plug domain-containing protein [Verrucomicrobiae bacterium]
MNRIYRFCAIVICVGMLQCPGMTNGQVTNPVLRLAPVVVIGTKEAEKSLSGAGTYLDGSQVRAFDLGDVHEILRQVPGVYVREEEGYGLRQNVSLRGVDPTRSSKVTLMEDGVLTAPAPYSAPQSYYTPNIHRMSGAEILKGSSQVRFGPHTTGGVINYLSTPVPESNQGFLRFLYGTDNEVRAHTWYGGRVNTDAGRFGYLAEFYLRRADGFKRIDLTPDFRDGDKTGFTLWEPMLKLAWDLPTLKRQSLEFKIGYTDLENDETYLGLNDVDFRANPIRRYSSTRFDEFNSECLRTYLRHWIELTEDVQLATTAYYQDFHRNWYKLDSLRNIQGGPASMSLSEALATPGAPLDTLRGANGGILRVRANNRDLWLAGVETVLDWRFRTGELPHEALAGFRYHTDVSRRLDWRDDYYQTSSGTITNVQRQVGGVGAADNRRDQTDAIAFFVQDSMSFGRLTVTPGVRFEHLMQEYYDRNAADPRTHSGTLDICAGGVGFNYRHNKQLTLFGGAYRGFSVPDPRSAVRDGLSEETSIATELGVRWEPLAALQLEMTLFYTRFENLIVIDNVVGAGAMENAGDINCGGVEWRAQYDP